MADSVGWSRVPAVVPSLAAIAVRRRFMIVRTRVRFARLNSARTWDCFARFRTDFFRFFTFTVAPCAIQFSSICQIDGITLSKAHVFVNEPQDADVLKSGGC